MQDNNLEIYSYNDKSDEEKEIRIIALDIISKINSKYQVCEIKNDHGFLRPCEFKDFAIIIDRGNSFDNFIKIFNEYQTKVAKQVEAEKVKTVKCELKVKFIKQVNIWVDTKFKIVKGHVANGRVVHVTEKTADGNFYVIDGGYVSTSSEFSLCSKMNQKPICKVMPFRDCTLFTYSDGKYGFNQLKAWNVCEAIEYKNGYYHIYMVGWCHESHLKRYALDSLSCTNGVV